MKKNRIAYFGSGKDIQEAIDQVNALMPHLGHMKEANARLKLQKMIDEQSLKANILLNGNRIWSKKRILRNLKRIIKHGILYNEDQTKPPILSYYFYQFLHLACGSVDHGDIWGWIHVYPRIENLKQFFKKNEFGKPVLMWIPEGQTDAREIVKEIEKKLFPFKYYMKQKKNKKTEGHR